MPADYVNQGAEDRLTEEAAQKECCGEFYVRPLEPGEWTIETDGEDCRLALVAEVELLREQVAILIAERSVITAERFYGRPGAGIGFGCPGPGEDLCFGAKTETGQWIRLGSTIEEAVAELARRRLAERKEATIP